MEEQMNQQTFSVEDPAIEQDEQQNEQLEENGQLTDFWSSDIQSKLKQMKRSMIQIREKLEEEERMREIEEEQQQIENKIKKEKDRELERNRITLQQRQQQQKLKSQATTEKKTKQGFLSQVRKMLWWNSSYSISTHRQPISDLSGPLAEYEKQTEEDVKIHLTNSKKKTC